MKLMLEEKFLLDSAVMWLLVSLLAFVMVDMLVTQFVRL